MVYSFTIENLQYDNSVVEIGNFVRILELPMKRLSSTFFLGLTERVHVLLLIPYQSSKFRRTKVQALRKETRTYDKDYVMFD